MTSWPDPRSAPSPASAAKKGDQLRSEDFEHRGERILVGDSESLRGCALLKEPLTCDCLVRSWPS